MYKTLVSLVILLSVAVVFQGCSTGAASGSITEKDNNKTIELEMDSPFTITLEGSMSTGDKWQLVSKKEPVIVLEKEEVAKNKDEDKVTYKFHFRVKDQGDETIVITYGNSNEIRKTFKFRVICGTMGRILSE